MLATYNETWCCQLLRAFKFFHIGTYFTSYLFHPWARFVVKLERGNRARFVTKPEGSIKTRGWLTQKVGRGYPHRQIEQWFHLYYVWGCSLVYCRHIEFVSQPIDILNLSHNITAINFTEYIILLAVPVRRWRPVMRRPVMLTGIMASPEK